LNKYSFAAGFWKVESLTTIKVMNGNLIYNFETRELIKKNYNIVFNDYKGFSGYEESFLITVETPLKLEFYTAYNIIKDLAQHSTNV
jgi:dipeptidyl aminopeptidase/acylaminoacyl peptidase